MKILQVTPTYPPAWSYGGISKMVYEITLELCKQGHEVEVWTSDALDLYSRVKNIDISTLMSGGKIRYLKNLSFALNRLINIHITPSIFISAKRKLKSFDVAHLHGARTFQNFAIYPFLKKYNIPYIFQAHGSLPRNFAKQSLKWIFDIIVGYKLLRGASKVIALSQMEADHYIDMGVPEEKIVIIPNWINLSEYIDLPSKGEFKKNFNIPKDKKIILYVGRIHMAKGIDFLLKSFAYLINNMNFKDVLLVIVGSDDGYLHEVKSLSDSLGISNSVLFTGLISNKDKISAYVDSSICCYLNPNEPFGLVSLEAAVSKLPVVVSEGTPMSEIVNRGGFGFSIKYGDVLALVKIVETVLNDEKLANEMGKCGREYVFENFGWDTIIDKYEMLYVDICARTVGTHAR